MAHVLALYKKPADAAAFDADYHGTHVPIAKTLPGLRSYEISSGPIATAGDLANFAQAGVDLLMFDTKAV